MPLHIRKDHPMPRYVGTLARIFGLTAAVLALTVAFASPSALAAGDPGGGPGESYAELTLDDFTLTEDMAVVFTGTLTCITPADVTISMAVQQGPPARFVSVYQAAQLDCEPGIAYPVILTFDPVHPALFHPGTLTVGIEMVGWTVPDDQGNGYYFQQFGVVEIDVRF